MSPLSASLVTFLLSIVTITHATTITVVNNCNFPVWPPRPIGPTAINAQQRKLPCLKPTRRTKMARIWGRTGCNFDGNGNGNGRCQTGGCGKLVCDPGNWGEIPKTLFEYTLAQPNNPTDTIDISLIEGFNLPISFTPTSNAGALNGKCRTISCTADINGQCVTGKYAGVTTLHEPGTQSCGANGDSKFFKQRCPDAYSFPKDDQSSTFSCPPGTNYKLTFCP
uniref:Osmotin-like protein n=1 Tax=Atriplex nummularia TaxID=3553 RepID=Q38745_ATRNU|nr:osmotin-like protein [Atriplex nummularia]prf//1908430A osmotin-like protein:ISOTYPE=pA8 [Atriplex nummularia]